MFKVNRSVFVRYLITFIMQISCRRAHDDAKINLKRVGEYPPSWTLPRDRRTRQLYLVRCESTLSHTNFIHYISNLDCTVVFGLKQITPILI